MEGAEVARDIHAPAKRISKSVTRTRHIMVRKKGEQNSACTFCDPKNSMFPIWPFSKVREQGYSRGFAYGVDLHAHGPTMPINKIQTRFHEMHRCGMGDDA